MTRNHKTGLSRFRLPPMLDDSMPIPKPKLRQSGPSIQEMVILPKREPRIPTTRKGLSTARVSYSRLSQVSGGADIKSLGFGTRNPRRKTSLFPQLGRFK